MFKSRLVAHWKPSGLSSMSCVLGIGCGFRQIRLLRSSLKSLMKRTVPSLLGVTNKGAAHSERLTRFSAPISTERSTSIWRVSQWYLGTGHGQAWHGLASGLSSISIGSCCHLPNVPLNKSSHFFNRLCNFWCCLLLCTWHRGHP